MVTHGGERPFGPGVAGTELRGGPGSLAFDRFLHADRRRSSFALDRLRHAITASRRYRVRAVAVGPPSDHEGAGNAGYRLIPMARQRKKCWRQEPQVQPDSPAFPAR
jgi:hypothetical protein